MNGILAAALSGALCAVAGGLIGTGAARLVERAAGRKFDPLRHLGAVGVAAGVIMSQGMYPARRGPSQADVDAVADKSAPIQAIRRYYPDVYRRLSAAVIQTAKTTRDAAAIGASARPVYTALLSRQAPRASDANAYQMLRLARDETVSLRARSARACAAFAGGQGFGGADPAAVFTRDEVEREAQIAAAVLEQTATAPEPPARPLDSAQAAALARSALGRLPGAEQASTLAMVAARRTPADDAELRGFCDFQVAMYDQILQAPPDRAGALFRSLIVTR